MIAAPQGHPVEFHSQARARERRYQQLFRPQFLAGAHGERVLPSQPQGLPLDRRLGRGLHRHEEPLVGLRQPSNHGTILRLQLRFGLPHLMRVEVQGFFVLEDGRPCQPATNRFIQVL